MTGAAMIDDLTQDDLDQIFAEDEGLGAIAGEDIMGIAEIAARFKVTKQVVTNWKSRFKDFPKPYANLAMGSIYIKRDIELWAKSHGKF